MSFIRDLLSSAAARGPSRVVCAVLYAAFAGTVTGWTALALARRGLPQYWSLLHRAALALVCVGGSVAWWWVNASVEGRLIVRVTPNHGVTTGDLLVAPALLLAAFLVVIEAAPRLRRAN